MREYGIMSAHRIIWSNYKVLKKQSRVIRCGYGLFGVYGYDSTGFDFNRSESDLEHAAGVQELISGIIHFFPDLIRHEDVRLYLDLARLHDIGENEIGDLPDDGTQNTVLKNQIERDVFTEYVGGLPNSYGLELLKFFIEFQKHSTRRGQIMYLADKLEAVLQGLIYESEGRYGDLKKYHNDTNSSTPSERDIDVAERIGETSLVDMWAYHFCKVAHACDGDIRNVFVGILYCAVQDVRKEWFPWWQKCL